MKAHFNVFLAAHVEEMKIRSETCIPYSVLAGKRETSDIYATLDFCPKRKPNEM